MREPRRSLSNLLARGADAEQREDWVTAEAAYRKADDSGDAEGAFRLGELLLDGARDQQQALEALRRADDRGHARAATRLGALVADSGDLVAGEQAFIRAHERGDAQATYFLGTIRDRAGDPQGAASYYNEALDRGFSMAGLSLGFMLRDLGDAPGSRRAFERGDALGHPECARHMAVHYHDDGNIPAAVAAARRADEGGSAGGSEFLAALNFGSDDRQAEEAARRADERGSALGAHILALLLQRRGDLRPPTKQRPELVSAVIRMVSFRAFPGARSAVPVSGGLRDIPACLLEGREVRFVVVGKERPRVHWVTECDDEHVAVVAKFGFLHRLRDLADLVLSRVGVADTLGVIVRIPAATLSRLPAFMM